MLYAKVKRGRDKGIQVTPHKFSDHTYHVRIGGRRNRIEKVGYDELKSYIRRGYMVWMSNKQHRHSAGGFAPRSIEGWK